MNKDNTSICCVHCGKKLLERTPEGTLHFCFGRKPDGSEEFVINMVIIGTVQVKCFRKPCGKINIINSAG